MTETSVPARGIVAVASSLAVGICTYALLRAGQALAMRTTDTALVLYDVHAAYFWRILASLYVSGMSVPLFLWIAQRSPERSERWLTALIFVAGLFITAQGLFVP